MVGARVSGVVIENFIFIDERRYSAWEISSWRLTESEEKRKIKRRNNGFLIVPLGKRMFFPKRRWYNKSASFALFFFSSSLLKIEFKMPPLSASYLMNNFQQACSAGIIWESAIFVKLHSQCVSALLPETTSVIFSLSSENAVETQGEIPIPLHPPLGRMCISVGSTKSFPQRYHYLFHLFPTYHLYHSAHFRFQRASIPSTGERVSVHRGFSVGLLTIICWEDVPSVAWEISSWRLAGTEEKDHNWGTDSIPSHRISLQKALK